MEPITLKDPLTGQVFIPKKISQKYASPENRIKHNNKKASILRQERAFLDKHIHKNHLIIKEIYKEFPSYESITIVSAGNFMRDHKYHDIRKFGIENNLNDYEVEEYAKRKDFELSSYFTKLNEFYEFLAIKSKDEQ